MANAFKIITATDAQQIAGTPCYTIKGMEHIVIIAHNARKNCRRFDAVDRNARKFLCQLASKDEAFSWLCSAARGRDIPRTETY